MTCGGSDNQLGLLVWWLVGAWTASLSRLFGYRLALSDRTEHWHEHCVEAVRPLDALSRQDARECSRGQQDRAVLPAAQASVGTDQRFECCNVKRAVFDAAVDVEVGGLRHRDCPAEHAGSMVAVRLERVSSGHLTGVEPDPTVRTEGPRHACRVEAGDESDAFVGAQARNELGPAFLEILQSEPDPRVHIQRAEIS